MEPELRREYYPDGTNGTIALNGITICATIELPWKNNCARVSCIPEGRYPVVKRYSHKFKHHYILEDVPQRQYIRRHPTNDALLNTGLYCSGFHIYRNGQRFIICKAIEK